MSTPEDIAQEIFSDIPKPSNSYGIITDDPDQDYSYGFEILLIILFEGLDIMVEGLDKLDEELTGEHFEIIQPWINSLGFNIEYYKLDNQELDNQQYCKVVFNNGKDSNFFHMKNIKKS